MISPETIRVVLSRWGLCPKNIRSDLALQGSPERSVFRTAFEDEAGGLFVLEQIAPAEREKKRFIRMALDQLQADGLKQIVPYIRTLSGESPAFCDGAWWQVAPFVAGTPLDRPGYVRDAGKGRALARFLGDLSRHAKNLPLIGDMSCFSLKGYILKLEKEMMQHDPDAVRRFAPTLDFLRRSFMDAHDTLPVAFCHGDYHPLNVIWQGDAIAAVIDWEFCGLKPEIYDIANLVGCLGMEHPSGLTDNLAMAFFEVMRQTSAVSTQSWNLLTEFIIALRFAWLAEWLRQKDKEMIELEATYMNLLVRSSDSLKETWKI